MFSKKRPCVGLDIKKNVIRLAIPTKNGLRTKEIVVNGNVLRQNRLRSAEEFSDVVGEALREFRGTVTHVAFAAINTQVLIRSLPVEETMTEKQIREHLFLELGESIQLPFEKPIFDLLVLPPAKRVRKKTQKVKNMRDQTREKITIKRNRLLLNGQISFIVTGEPVLESIGKSLEISGKIPASVDFSALVYTRLFRKNIKWNQNFILLEIDSGEAMVTIFQKMTPIYTQYENYNSVGWKYIEKNGIVIPNVHYGKEHQLLAELGQKVEDVCGYFSKTLASGQTIDQVYLVGDHPQRKKEVKEILQQKIQVPVKTLSKVIRDADGNNLADNWMLAVGLASKEV